MAVHWKIVPPNGDTRPEEVLMITVFVALTPEEAEQLERTLVQVLEYYQGDTHTHAFLVELGRAIQLIRGKEKTGLKISRV